MAKYTEDIVIQQIDGPLFPVRPISIFAVEIGWPPQKVFGKFSVRPCHGDNEGAWEMIEERSGLVLSDPLWKKLGIAGGLYEHAVLCAYTEQARMERDGIKVGIMDRTRYKKVAAERDRRIYDGILS